MTTITLKSLSKTFTITADTSENVYALKKRICSAEQIPIEQQRLILGGKMMDDLRLLSDYQIGPDTVIQLTQRLPVGPAPRNGTVTFQFSEREVTLENLYPTATVLLLKQLLVEKPGLRGVSVESLHILYNDTLCENQKTCEDYRMFADFTPRIFLTFQPDLHDMKQAGEGAWRAIRVDILVKVEESTKVIPLTVRPILTVADVKERLKEKCQWKKELYEIVVTFNGEIGYDTHTLQSFGFDEKTNVTVQFTTQLPPDDAKVLRANVSKIDGFVSTFQDIGRSYDTHPFADVSLKDFVIDTSKPLGQGANGQVFEAKLAGTDHAYALKKLWDFGSEVSLNEFQFPAKYPHENLCRVLAYFQDKTINPSEMEAKLGTGQTWYFVMDKGKRTLEQYILGQKLLPENTLLWILLQILKAVAHLYSNGIVHRDIKPADIFVSESLQVVLGDFGCATNALVTYNRDGAMSCHPPEGLVPSERLINCKMFDIWAVGCLVYFLVKENHPFLRFGKNKDTLPLEFPAENPPLPKEYPQLEVLVKQLLQRDPAIRIRPAEAVRLVENMLWPTSADLQTRLVETNRRCKAQLQRFESKSRKWGIFLGAEEKLLSQFLLKEASTLLNDPKLAARASISLAKNQSYETLKRDLVQMGFAESRIVYIIQLLLKDGKVSVNINEIFGQAVDEKAFERFTLPPVQKKKISARTLSEFEILEWRKSAQQIVKKEVPPKNVQLDPLVLNLLEGNRKQRLLAEERAQALKQAEALLAKQWIWSSYDEKKTWIKLEAAINVFLESHWSRYCQEKAQPVNYKAMNVKELINILKLGSVPFQDCLDKESLVERCEMSLKPSPIFCFPSKEGKLKEEDKERKTEYEVDFEKMQISFKENKSTFPIRRDRASLPQPTEWIPHVGQSTKHLLHPLHPSSDVFQKVQKTFIDTLGLMKITISKIECVQNPYLWDAHVALQEAFLQYLPLEKLNTQYLFHGSAPDILEKICDTGFNRIYTQTHIYGKGVYYAKDSNYSLHPRYSSGNQILLCRVLVGEYHENQDANLKEPHRRTQAPYTVYESMVNQAINPTIFVTSRDHQAYPSYLITFVR